MSQESLEEPLQKYPFFNFMFQFDNLCFSFTIKNQKQKLELSFRSLVFLTLWFHLTEELEVYFQKPHVFNFMSQPFSVVKV